MRPLLLTLSFLLACRPGDSVDITDSAETDVVHTDTDPSDWSTARDCSLGPAPASSSSSVTTNPFRAEIFSDSGGARSCLFVEDLDGDGHLDIAWFDEGSEGVLAHVALRWGDGTGGFVEEQVPMSAHISGHCAAADVDRDGRLDLVLGGLRDFTILLQPDTRTFTVVNDLVELPADDNGRRRNWILPVDANRDGTPEWMVSTPGSLSECEGVALDDDSTPYEVLLPNHLDQNSQIHCLSLQDGVYRPDPDFCPASLNSIASSELTGVMLDDLDLDGIADVVLANDFSGNIILRGTGSGFEDLTAGTGLDKYNHAMGIAVADYDGDGRRDLYFTDLGPDALWRGTGCGTWEVWEGPSGVAEATARTVSWGVVALDVELDGDVDLFVTNSNIGGPGFFTTDSLCAAERFEPTADFLLLNDGTGRFTRIDVPHEPEADMHWTRIPVGFGDLDEDGDLDLVVIEYPQLRVLFNEAPAPGHYLGLQARSGRLPVWGVSVEVIEPEGRRSAMLQPREGTSGASAARHIFGFGDRAGPVDLRITWPDGQVEDLTDVELDQNLVLERAD